LRHHVDPAERRRQLLRIQHPVGRRPLPILDHDGRTRRQNEGAGSNRPDPAVLHQHGCYALGGLR
jgi:hypothetical protein